MPIYKGPARIIELKKAYEKAVADKQETFKVGDYEFVTGYAEYLIEYLLKIKKMPETTVLKTFLQH